MLKLIILKRDIMNIHGKLFSALDIGTVINYVLHVALITFTRFSFLYGFCVRFYEL